MKKEIEANYSAGVMKLYFTSNISKQELLEKFNEFLFSSGELVMENSQCEEVELDICQIEYVEFDEESDY